MVGEVQQIIAPFSAESLFSGSLSMAGLVLVFLGIILTAFNSFDTEQQAAVRSKYRCQAMLAFFGFLFCLGSALLALLSNTLGPTWAITTSLGALLTSMLLTAIASFMVLGEIKG